jgi:glycosyltransferase involved in cell wall biosynthesis
MDKLVRFRPSQVIAINHRGENLAYPPIVKAQIIQEDRTSYAQAAEFINGSPIDAVVLQHEFGIFGGTNGNYILTFLNNLTKPVITTFHTVLPNVDPHRKSLVQEIAAHSAAVVVLAHRGKEILTQVYKVAPNKIHVIYHGVPILDLPPGKTLKRNYGWEARTLLCTFGLLHPGKGIEYVISALPSVVRKYPKILYLVLGQTHPEVYRRDGEAYRRKLENLVAELGLTDHVVFVNRYLTQEELLSYLRMTDIYITPYLDPQQISSGTLAYAICLGKVIISTPYIYAQEMLASGRGILVPFADAKALALALEEVLANPRKARQLSENAWTFGQRMTWPKVAEAYANLISDVVAVGAKATSKAGV